MRKTWPEENKKLCSMCEQIKDIIEFHKCSRGGAQSACKICRSEYQKRLNRNKVFKIRDIKSIINLDSEVWKDIDGYENYQISNFGRIKIKQHFDGKSCYEEKIKKLATEKGYHITSLCKDGEYKPFSVHRLVAKTFIPNPYNLPTVHHIDHIRNNNHISNLKWATMQENCSDVIRVNAVFPKSNITKKLNFEYDSPPDFLINYNDVPIDEIWKTINNRYSISNYSRIKNIETGRLLRQYKNSDDYLEMKTDDTGTKSIHRLVAENFIENLNNYPQVNHIDGNKFNNKVSNLEWVTAKQNVQHALKMGLRVVGESHQFSKLKEIDVLNIRRLHEDGLSIRKIKGIYNIDERTVRKIIRRESWKHLV